MTAAALPREYSHAIERRLGALLLTVIPLFSPSGILANRDAYRVGLIPPALPQPLVAIDAVAGGADPKAHPARAAQ